MTENACFAYLRRKAQGRQAVSSTGQGCPAGEELGTTREEKTNGIGS
ncbi:hypothetical protein SELSPUOL_02374 [Selenomonas sputigena ATCC 35185]|uniref:Uncharacterized protein n=1 Tax=Selenomonas sputigena (strain ATCC 35185 / DSM 20758 / CCUG 44933 / VPI D19B-28) TaxID=546271 RepID=C9LY15_SELS3|nr:hypothetical protein SELSPUOL_02374 [Selenomonas sputigena ATCC 35185]